MVGAHQRRGWTAPRPVRWRRVVPDQDGQIHESDVPERKEAETPKAPCLGNVNEPTAEKANLCVYRGGNAGSKEEEDTNAKFATFEEPIGTESTTAGKLGALVVFRTEEGIFAVGETPITLAKPAYLVAGGSWAVTAE